MISFFLSNAVGTTRCFEDRDSINHRSQYMEAQFDDRNRSSSTMEAGSVRGSTSYGGVLVGECSVTLTQVAAAIGDYWVGTFTGRLVSDFPRGSFMVAGDFRLRRQM